MKRGFTLVELMIVAVVLVTLMAIVFRIAGITGPYEARARTIKRMQCLENCLSGYYAAFGSYPPVKLHGSRDIYLSVDKWGIQEEDGQTVSSLSWGSVKAACRSQPIAARYPFSSDSSVQEMVRIVSEELMRRSTSDEKEYEAYRKNVGVLGNGFDALARPSGEIDNPRATDWREVQIFQFGLMSYLLPRYLFMTLGDEGLYDGTYAQWDTDNSAQKQCHGDGRSTYTWASMRSDVFNNHWAYVEMIPSQAACARWMPNLEGIVSCGQTFFGVDTRDPRSSSPINVDNPYPEVFCPTKNPSNQYVLDGMTVRDGWGNDFYYYSPPPYQSYRLWSSGADGRTFPPWIELSSLQGNDRITAGRWMADDITSMSN